jgi:hypothetical protein
MACPNCLDCNNPCNECQENTPVTPQPYTPALPPCNTGCEFEVFTDCVLLSEDMELCNVEYPKNSPLTQILIDLINSTCCNCASCEDVIKNIDLDFYAITKNSSDFNALNSNYFTKNDLIQQISFEDNSNSTDVVSYLKYKIPLINAEYILTNNTLGTYFTINTNIYGRFLTDYPHEFFLNSEMTTSRNCYEFKQGEIDFNLVPYSERIAEPYRFNCQINNVPIVKDYNYPESIDKGILYIADTITNTSFINSNGGSVIRKVNLNNREIETISGKPTNEGSFITINGKKGNDVLYGRASSIILDMEEMYNDEPVLYFCTYGTTVNIPNSITAKGGVVCRLVKESNDNDSDNRSNWTTHVIANVNNEFATISDPASPLPGNEATFQHLHGLKKWFNINGAPSFYIYEATSSSLYFMYHTGDGSMNSASNWMVQKVIFPSTLSYNNPETGRDEIYPVTLGGISSNINVDDHDGNSQKLILTTENGLYEFHWNGSIPPLVSDCIDLTGADWDGKVVTYNASNCLSTSEVNGTFDQIIGTNAVTVYNPNYVYRPTGESEYLYGTGRAGTVLKTAIRSYEQTGTTTYLHTTKLVELNSTGTVSATIIRQGVGNSDLSTTPLNGLSEGFFNDLKGNLYDITYGGIRLWSDDLSTCNVYIGQESNTATELKQSLFTSPALTYRMDTQYQVNLTI